MNGNIRDVDRLISALALYSPDTPSSFADVPRGLTDAVIILILVIRRNNPILAVHPRRGPRGVDWGGVDWGGVDWRGVDWGGVDWGRVDWGRIDWGGVHWGRVDWGGHG